MNAKIVALTDPPIARRTGSLQLHLCQAEETSEIIKSMKSQLRRMSSSSVPKQTRKSHRLKIRTLKKDIKNLHTVLGEHMSEIRLDDFVLSRMIEDHPVTIDLKNEINSMVLRIEKLGE